MSPPNSTADVLSLWVPYEYSRDTAERDVRDHVPYERMERHGCRTDNPDRPGPIGGTETVIGPGIALSPGSSEVSANITTTGGFYGGDRTVIRIKTAGNAPQVSSTTVTYKAERSKNIPAYKRFPETTR